MMASFILSVLPALAGIGTAWGVRRAFRIAGGERISALEAYAPPQGSLTLPTSAQRLFMRLGGAVLAVFKQPENPAFQLRLGIFVVTGFALALVQPLLALVGFVTVVGHSILRRRRQNRLAKAALTDELPDVVDLLMLAVSAGMNISMALEVVARTGHGIIASTLAKAHQRAGFGASLPDVLSASVDDLGEEVRPLMNTLAGSLRDGTSIVPNLERLSIQVRTERRRQAEERARKLPVRLLFPLVLCVLPAFGLLSVVPLLITGLADLSF